MLPQGSSSSTATEAHSTFRPTSTPSSLLVNNFSSSMSSTEETARGEMTTQVAERGGMGMVLPMEIIEQIALYLADNGSRSAVTAALIYPDLKKKCFDRMFENGVTAHIGKPSSLDNFVKLLSARDVPIHVGTLRFQPSTFCSLRQEDNVKRVLNHLLEVEYKIDELQLFLPNSKSLFDPEYINKAFLSSVRNLTILHGPYPLQHIGVAFHVEEVTLVEPAWFAIWALRLLPRLKVLHLFFTEDDEYEEENWWYPNVRRYALCGRRGILEKLHLIKTLPAEKIYFIVMDGDSHPNCLIQFIRRVQLGTTEHIFYRYYSTSGMNDFQRLDAAKDLIRQWETNFSR